MAPTESCPEENTSMRGVNNLPASSQGLEQDFWGKWGGGMAERGESNICWVTRQSPGGVFKIQMSPL